VSVAYLAAAALPCGLSDSVVNAAAALAREASADASQPAPHPVDPHAHHRAQPEAPEAAHTGHAGHAGHSAKGHGAHTADDATAAERTAATGTKAKIGAPCACGCSDAPDPAGNSSARVGFALARDAWPRAPECAPLLHAAIAVQPHATPTLGSDPIPI